MTTVQSITIDQFEISRVIGLEPVAKQMTDEKTKQAITYNEIELLYNYGTDEEPIVSSLYIELPEVSASGIYKKDEGMRMGKNGPYPKISYSTKITFDLAKQDTREELQKCIAQLHDLYMKTSEIMGEHKGKLRYPKFDPKNPEVLYKNPVIAPSDAAGVAIDGKNPYMYLKLNPFGANKTVYVDLAGTTQNWNSLENVFMRGVPLIHFSNLYCGAKPSLQCKMVNMVITHVEPAGGANRQVGTVERLQAKYGKGAVDNVAAQLATLNMARQESLAQTATNNDFGGEGETEGVEEDTGSMSSTALVAKATPMAKAASKPSAGAKKNPSQDQDLQDFLSAQPPMNATTAEPAPVKLSIKKQPIPLN